VAYRTRGTRTRRAQRTVSVAAKESEEVSEADPHHDVDVLEHRIVHVTERLVRVGGRLGISGGLVVHEEAEEDDHDHLDKGRIDSKNEIAKII